MNKIVNGEKKDLSPESTVSSVIQQFQLPESSFVIELNGEIIDKDVYSKRVLHKD